MLLTQSYNLYFQQKLSASGLKLVGGSMSGDVRKWHDSFSVAVVFDMCKLSCRQNKQNNFIWPISDIIFLSAPPGQSLGQIQSRPDMRRKSVIYRGGSHVFAAVWDLGLVGVVGTADHWAGGREAVAPHHTAAGLTWWHSSLPQLPVPRAGRAPFGMHDGHGGPAFVVEDSGAQTHRDSYKEYSAYSRWYTM